MTFSFEVNYEILKKMIIILPSRDKAVYLFNQSLKNTKRIFQNCLQGRHLSELVIICENTTAKKWVRSFVYEGC